MLELPFPGRKSEELRQVLVVIDFLEDKQFKNSCTLELETSLECIFSTECFFPLSCIDTGHFP